MDLASETLKVAQALRESEDKSTPRPWSVDTVGEANIRGADLTIVAVRHRLPKDQQRANADLIVRAVNAHDALVAALTASREQIIKLARDEYELNETEHVALLDQIDVALAAAKGEC